MRHDLHSLKPGMSWAKSSVAGLVLALSAGAAGAAPPLETGVWINHTGKGAVEIRPCAASGAAANRLCGFIVWRVSEGWDNGWVYDPEQGSQFDAAIVAGRDRLILTGYKGVKFFSKSFNWRRAPADLPRCDQPHEARATPTDIKLALPHITPPRPVPAVRPAIE
jgi:uncharacterized protein (DUF2147 family)